MANLGERIQSADWKKEKHVPVIECLDQVRPGEAFEVRVSVGKEVAHPNTTEHHIRWIMLLFQPEGDRFTYDVARVELNAHGESAAGPNQGPVYSHPVATVVLRIGKPGTLHALALCNIHGLWETSKAVAVGMTA